MRFFLLSLFCFFLIPTVLAQNRVALVIGNGNYSQGSLRNPTNDAQDISQILKGLGFQVTHLENSARADMLRAVQRFKARLSGNTEVAFFFYAGHGAQFEGDSYLLPLKASIASTADLPIEALKAKDILTQMRSSGSKVNVMVLDACRNLPFPALKRGGTRGLARLDAIGRALIAYSTSPGNTAADGRDRNSPYTKALKHLLPQKNLTLTQLFNDVGVAVDRRTQGQQTPWISSSPMPPIYLAGKKEGVNAGSNNSTVRAITNSVVKPRPSYEPEMVKILCGRNV